ncbi:sugar transferase [Roseomonas sp. OT10]|uniref:sugar transferase n=1 Tax=Roseomonas cutis TaxID=2897332 RepID=UPI001E437C32|nr:sugar transferase [Roseomonas sp. OT10]UFN50470.1 sugar transferase [Roseomonas sp. OT10]
MLDALNDLGRRASTPTLMEQSAGYGLPAVALDAASSPAHSEWTQGVKRGFDVSLAIVLLVILAPLMLILALAVRKDGGPAFYGHRRVGRGGVEFPCLKFRSMVINSDQVLQELLARDPVAAKDWATNRKLRHDPRVTRIGRFLRATSLDELPQIINVLRGEMSFVGPRPVVTDELRRHYGAATAHYIAVRPGITGLWQISGRSDTTYVERVELDQRYVQEFSILQDLRILLRTVPAVLARRGAY